MLSSFPVDTAEADCATHMVIDVLKKTEKLLCSIASGLWVLHPSYLEECKERGRFIEVSTKSGVIDAAVTIGSFFYVVNCVF